MSNAVKMSGVIAVALLLFLVGKLEAAAGALPTKGNGVLGQLGGEGGDRVLGTRIYGERCAACHDHPSGRIPSKEAIADNTPVFLANTMFEGVMRPMARGLSLHEIASLAAYLSTRIPSTVGAVVGAPACKQKPSRIDLATTDQWNGWGRSGEQTRFQPNPGFSVGEIPRLKVKWAFSYSGSRNGQATVVGKRLFLNASSGAIYSLDANTGSAYWRFDAPAPSRGSIVVGPMPSAPSGHAIYFTDFSRNAYALDADSGALIWKTQVDHQQEVQLTGSPMLHDGRLFVPISSAEEAIAGDPNYPCCKFRGALAAVDARSGRLLWESFVTPNPAAPFKKKANGAPLYGPAGGAIWSAPTIDAKRHLIYVGTGDSYTDLSFSNADAIVAIDEASGEIRWSRQFTRDDAFIQYCDGFLRGPNCPTILGPDHDFGASPILRTLANGQDVLLVGQKSGAVYALDPEHDGKVVWTRRLSPGGPLGGIEFGMAADLTTVYAPISDIYVSRTEAKPGMAALKISDGTILWQVRPQQKPCHWNNVYCFPGMSQAVSSAPGAVFAGSMDGRFRAFDATTGRTIWEFDTGAAPLTTVAGGVAQGGVLDGAGPTISGGIVYVNSGYWGRSGKAGSVLIALSVDGK